ncbi:ABC transporter permease [Georgenia sp. MJ206]|uniref:ABC transporter permease n=1 Tax=Georgenia wangjunii TaxID=3117730 RepID=UPI002F25F2E4
MRRSTGRLAAGAIAIIIGTAFIAAALLGTTLIRDTSYAAMTASIGDADVIVNGDLTAADLTTVRETEGTALADGILEVQTSLGVGERGDSATLRSTPSPGLETVELAEGTFPRASGELAITAASAKRLEAEIGDDVDVALQGANGEGEETGAQAQTLRLVGILTDPLALFADASTALAAPEQLTRWASAGGADLRYTQILVVAEPGTSAEDLSTALSDALPQTWTMTSTELAEQMTRDVTGTTLVFTVLILAFGAIAMFVAAIVITNTFQVLVAQRTHTLALLRCVGATKRQIRRSVLTEALILGVLAGVGGLILGVALAQGTLLVLGTQDLGLGLPATVHLTPAVVLAPLLTGAVVTVLAALAPARAATRVSPLAALRPAAPPDARAGSRGRLVLSLLAVAGGAAALIGGVLLARSDAASPDDALTVGLSLGIFGGVLSFVGVMIGAVFVVPGLVSAFGRVTARLGGGSTATLATANAVRNPRRTAATATALVIGVTLVTLMSTGAVSMRASLGFLLDESFPADVEVRSTAWTDGKDGPLTATQIEAVRGADGVTDVAEIRTAPVVVTNPAMQESTAHTNASATDLDDAAAVLRDTRPLEGLEAGTVALGGFIAMNVGVEVGDEVELQLEVGQPDGSAVPDGEVLTLVVSSVTSPVNLLVTPATLGDLTPEAPLTTILARLASEGDQAAMVTGIQDRLTAADAGTAAATSPPYVNGPAAERALFEDVINTLLAVVVGLLGVAVLIALIGVANTLSLSVIERRRESALLRAMGMTRRQLRVMLATEGVLLALVGVVIGIVLGMVYGWAGTAVVLGQSGGVTLAVPWVHLGAVVVVAVLAGLAASVLPARSSVRTPPVVALAA